MDQHHRSISPAHNPALAMDTDPAVLIQPQDITSHQRPSGLTSHQNEEPSTTTSTVSTTKPEDLEARANSLASTHSFTEKPPPPDDANALDETPTSASEFEYPPTSQRLVVITAILLAVFLIALDRTIIATAIPKMTDEFHSLDDIGWYGSAFMLTSSCFQLLIGRVYTFHSPKWVFLVMIFIFEVGSALCGAAPSSTAFIVGRAIAGIGSAGVMAGAIILMTMTIPLAKRPLYMGFFGACFGLASVVGPLLGGVFTTDVTWRWCFYINLPIGAVSLVAIFFILKPTPPSDPGRTLKEKLARLDLLGELCLFPCVICLLLALQWGGTTYAWNDGRIIALFTLFGVLLIGFVLVQVFTQKTATIQASVINNRSIVAGMWLTFCVASAMMALIYFLPTWFQAIKDKSAVKSGIDTIPMVLSLVVGNIAGGQITGRIGYYNPQALAGVILMPIGAGLITTFNENTHSGKWIGYQILFGLGLGLAMQQGPMAAQTVLARRDVPVGVSLMMFMQQLGGAVFVSVGQNVFDTTLVRGLVTALPDLRPGDIVN
ncbi:putative HC-toxin efflux carrier TOXA, partial [Teratosphaeria destructans]